VRSFYAERCRSGNVMKAVLSMRYPGTARRNDSAPLPLSRYADTSDARRSTSRFTSSQKIMAQSETELCGAFERPWRKLPDT